MRSSVASTKYCEALQSSDRLAHSFCNGVCPSFPGLAPIAYFTSAFAAGLRSKYGLNSRSAAQVIEDALNSDQLGLSQESPPQPYSALAFSSPDRQAMQQSLMNDNQLLHPAESRAILSQGDGALVFGILLCKA